ncbi:hypothetical protein FA95DRAFT_1257457 [Auriscalpium vulgare]|uniref:Uncharacterized protein n=1 Tax=Auriscalpium vulgare TaxID=40419 RepID=A0ACB8S8J5_9AGAM|nr:hypothetical protein FA95DRAFT_1257457 [Auriscalpium vulgare]
MDDQKSILHRRRALSLGSLCTVGAAASARCTCCHLCVEAGRSARLVLFYSLPITDFTDLTALCGTHPNAFRTSVQVRARGFARNRSGLTACARI